jgi:hypothetical protein
MKIRAPGTENINAELIQTARPQTYRRFYRLLLNICNQEGMSNEWYLVLICPINNKGDKPECCQCRGISVLIVVYKILADVTNNRLTQYAGHLTGEYQNGFRNNKATTDNIYAMYQLLKNAMNI